MIIISHPTGNQNFRNAAEAFFKENLLAKAFTTIVWNKDSVVAGLLPDSLTNELAKRSYTAIPSNLVSAYPYRELGRLLAKKMHRKALIKHNTGIFSVDKVYRSFDKHVAKQISKLANINQVYCYEDGALESFKVAKSLGIETIYELPIGYWRAAQQILGEEAQLKPEWANTILSTKDNAEKLARKDQEIGLADKIIVPSQFVADTLKLFEDDLSKKIQIVPYGGPPSVEAINPTINKKLKVLFVGGLSQRKGLSYLFDAIGLLKGSVELTVIGHKVNNDCAILNQELLKHRYIPALTHKDVLQEMYNHDVLVFPSLFEGFGLVILEAMAQGIPVITTANAGPGDAVIDGKNGYLIPIRSHEIVAEKIKTLADNPDLLHNMKLAALEQAKKSSWALYQKMLVSRVID
ncbi:glycosyltransferase family 4 protein [Methylobacter psychrophilus]|uniref:glycosyltransferase family 4 protein n=1 Tax=Methylobacter psychrophilus TaxID=96941 RepID=UPI0021D503BF|nr:glycosyltransferase family 4 protein [Methylobacter psychrophilus]